MSEEHLLRAEAALRGSTSPITIEAFGVSWAAMGGIVNRQLECVKLTLVPCYEAFDLSPEALTAAVWSGEGRPPVGCVCELWAGVPPIDQFDRVKIIADDEGALVYRYLEGPAKGRYQSTTQGAVNFRPLRTAEQLAAEAREAAIAEMAEATRGAHNWNEAFGKLYDRGARLSDA